MAFAPPSDIILLHEISSFSKLTFISTIFAIPSSVILLSDKLSSLSVLFNARNSPMATAPSLDILLCEISSI